MFMAKKHTKLNGQACPINLIASDHDGKEEIMVKMMCQNINFC